MQLERKLTLKGLMCLIILLYVLIGIVWVSLAHAATGDILSVTVINTTAAADVTSACNTPAACDGWVAEVVVNGVASGGTYSLGIGAHNNPANAKIVCTATSPGYDAGGNATTINRTLYGTKILRKVYNSGYTTPYPNDETSSGGNLYIRVALSDVVYNADTVSCNIAAGFYNDGTHSSNAASGVSAVNDSTLAYSQARVIANWSWPGFTRITGPSFTVRAVAFQRHAQNGKPVAAVLFTATDQHSNTVTALVNTPTIDPAMQDAGGKVIEYIGTLSTSTLTQGDLITVNFRAMPWVGDSTSIMNTADGVNAQPTPLYAPEYFINDKSGTYGTGAVVVDGTSGNDNTCQAVAESAFNGSSDAATLNPCQTIGKAGIVLRAWNAANSSPARTDEAGTVYVKAGTYSWIGESTSIGASSGTNYDKAWSTVTTFPGVAQSAVIINGITASGNYWGTTPLKVSGITVNVTSGSPVEIFNANGSYLWIHNCALTMTSGMTLIYGWPAVYWTDNTVGSNATCNQGSSSSCAVNAFTNYSTTSPADLVRGNNLTGLGFTVNGFTFLGNLFDPSASDTSFAVQTWDNASSGYMPTDTQPIWAFNRLYNFKITSGSPINLFGTQSAPIGAAVVQNVFEYNNSVSTPLIRIAADASTNNPVNNVMLWDNSVVGQRINRCYNDQGSAAYLRTGWSEIGMLYESAAIKADTFGTPNAARIGNWTCEYGAGSRDSIDGEIGTSGTPVGVNGTFQGEFTGLDSYFISTAADGTPNTQTSTEPPSNSAAMHAGNWYDFVNRQAWDGTSTHSGDGDYHLTFGSPSVDLVPISGAVLPFDIDGNTRFNDGHGSAGAYEKKPDTTAGAVF